ncbi:diacylglycerol kinase [Ciceribacter sp. L1K23]|uniref:diacylglycerol kinase n=1 Tax=Ciceribacter sp. L1K23 TaxID=2820276 RepID=UPI001B816411|nr:diacylglycerol kinase [Ciceribacter sp. L1K23]MBR0555219.1 diacylglycerol kinase [Ciceribacter sp. L1K23]
MNEHKAPEPDIIGNTGIRKERGIAHFFAASRYSFQGFKRLTQESAFRHELLAYAGIIVLFAVLGASFNDYLLFSVLAFVLFAVEALNTAIEEIIDRISPEFSIVAKHAKDLGSFAVFCLLVANAVFVASVVIRTALA